MPVFSAYVKLGDLGLLIVQRPSQQRRFLCTDAFPFVLYDQRDGLATLTVVRERPKSVQCTAFGRRDTRTHDRLPERPCRERCKVQLDTHHTHQNAHHTAGRIE